MHKQIKKQIIKLKKIIIYMVKLLWGYARLESAVIRNKTKGSGSIIVSRTITDFIWQKQKNWFWDLHQIT